VYTILLYYKYINIDNPAGLADSQRILCEKLGLKGRIIIAKEGINGTIEGTNDSTEKYINEMCKDERFSDIHFKKSIGTAEGKAFPKLSIKVRSEIVSSHIDHTIDTRGKYLSPQELNSWFNEGRDFVIVDMRNSYEHAVGHFRESILPKLNNFRDLKKVVSELDSYKDKTVLSVCTGGVRCEKASGYLIKAGFKDVYQLEGGIVSYMEKYPGQDFLGSLYVFDGRIVIRTDDIGKKTEHTVVGKCNHCIGPCESYINCIDDTCHKHFICCEKCKVDHRGLCTSCSYGSHKNVVI
jgi:UPF0176 protein